jgi:hypothetical protein
MLKEYRTAQRRCRGPHPSRASTLTDWATSSAPAFHPFKRGSPEGNTGRHQLLGPSRPEVRVGPRRSNHPIDQYEVPAAQDPRHAGTRNSGLRLLLRAPDASPLKLLLSETPRPVRVDTGPSRLAAIGHKPTFNATFRYAALKISLSAARLVQGNGEAFVRSRQASVIRGIGLN